MDKGKVQISDNKIKFECRHQFCPLTREQFNTTNNYSKVQFMQKINEEKYKQLKKVLHHKEEAP